MDIAELENALKRVNYMKRTIDENTSEITERVKSWCLNEYGRLYEESDKLEGFFRDAKETFAQDESFIYYESANFAEYQNGEFFVTLNGRARAALCINMEKSLEVGRYTELPKPNGFDLSHMTQNVVKPDYERKDIDYWVDYRKYLAVQNEYLGKLAEAAKAAIDRIGEKQKERFNEIAKTCGEIDGDEGKTVEVTIRIR
jgi:hypothetical protein